MDGNHEISGYGHKQQLARLLYAWLDCFALLKLGTVEVCALIVLLVSSTLTSIYLDDRPTDRNLGLKWQTLKTCFLLSLASAQSEVFPACSHSGSRAQCIQTGWFGWTINSQPVARTRFYSQESVTPPSSFMGENPWDWPLDPWRLERMLCHVRKLYLYLNDTRNIRRGRTRVFIHWNQSIRDIYQSHISKGKVEVVKTAYLSSDEDLLEKVTIH